MTMSKRPLIVITYPYPIGQKAAGGSRTTREVARHLTQAGADVVIMPVSTNPLSRRFPRKAPDPAELAHELDGELAQEGIEIVRPAQNPLAYQLDGISVKREMRRILATRHVDLVLGHYHEAGFLPDLLRRHGVQFGFLATWQTYAGLAWKPVRLAGKVRKWFEKRVIVEPHRKADIHFAISEFTRQELIDVLGVEAKRIHICPLGVEPSFLEVPREKPDRIHKLIFFGRLTPSKGFRDAIQALGILAKRGVTDWTYKLFGSGRPEWARAAAEEQGLTGQIEICDPVDTATLRRELADAHLAILPSHVESFGHSFVEAQASGIPVVGYSSGSVPEVVENGTTGWLAPLHDVEALADLLGRAMQDTEGTYAAGIRGRERVRAKYAWENTARIILEGSGLDRAT